MVDWAQNTNQQTNKQIKLKKIGIFQMGGFWHCLSELLQTPLLVNVSWFADPETLNILKWQKFDLGINFRLTAVW